MACSDSQQLYRKLESDFKVARALPTARAAVGLMAVLLSWKAEGNSGLVAMSACVCHDVVAAVLGAGCTPVFCDIDPTDGEVYEKEWAKSRTVGASVALVVHLYGNPVDLSVVRRYFPFENCLIIEDAAQALGAMNAFGYVGGQGDVGLLSFGPTKHIDTGGAAILFKDSKFADSVNRTLNSIKSLPENERKLIFSEFRKNFEAARHKLRLEDPKAVAAFDGQLNGYDRALQLAFPIGAEYATLLALKSYPDEREQRLQKSLAWGVALEGSGLVPVGMGAGAVPWRYTCRLPGITWKMQYILGEAMRSCGMNVSHWYVPAHWMCGHGEFTLPGTERLAQEVFQFWIDHSTSLEKIENDASLVRDIAKSYIPNRHHL